MKIKELFKKDIARSIQGVVTIGNEDEAQKWQELEEYVCTDEITKSFRTFFRRYRESLSTPTDKMGVWITGFFGSGKSHFLKILGYLLANEEVAGQRAKAFFEEKIQDSMVLADINASANAKNKVVLFNIDSKAKSNSKMNTAAIMDIMLRAFNESVGVERDSRYRLKKVRNDLTISSVQTYSSSSCHFCSSSSLPMVTTPWMGLSISF